MKLSQILIAFAIIAVGACTTAKERYFECIREQQNYMNSLKDEIIGESSRRRAPHPSDTFQKRYGDMFGNVCSKEYEEYKKEERGY